LSSSTKKKANSKAAKSKPSFYFQMRRHIGAFSGNMDRFSSTFRRCAFG
jgi:hypothetical protein